MELARVKVSGILAVTEKREELIPKGIKGAPVHLPYSDDWADLNKTVVFQGSGITKDILNAGEDVAIPAEIVARTSAAPVQVGVYGTNADGTLAIPTLWAELGRVSGAADPSGDESTDPALPVWAQLQADVEELMKGDTGGGAVDPDAIGEAVEDYLEKNPPAKGEDGISPTVTVAAIEGGTRVYVTDVNGTKSFDVLNGEDGAPGKDGEDGADGHTPVRYVDYWTEADQTAIVNAVLAKFTDASEVGM